MMYDVNIQYREQSRDGCTKIGNQVQEANTYKEEEDAECTSG